MGCGGSSSKTSPLSLWSDLTRFPFPFEGDGESLTRTNVDPAMGEAKWKQLKANDAQLRLRRRRGASSETDPMLELELTALLEDPIGYQYFAQYLRSESYVELCDCWSAIESFRKSSSGPLATSIFHNYVLECENFVSRKIVTNEDRSACCSRVKTTLAITGVAPRDLYDWLQKKCFMGMYWAYVEFKTTVKYVEMTYVVRHTYNTVGEKDFEYISKLGEGGFGMVVHCRKKSTGKHYAMKIQSKVGLYYECCGCPWRVDKEIQACIACQHPYIVNLSYAFQTKSMVMLVMSLGSAGDLWSVMNAAKDKKISAVRVTFYAAEISCALMYLHGKGLIYRDLKPSNVLLNSDGHIQLTDFGGVVDIEGRTLRDTAEIGVDAYSPFVGRSASEAVRTPPRPDITTRMGVVAPQRRGEGASAGAGAGTGAGHRGVSKADRLDRLRTRERQIQLQLQQQQDGDDVCLSAQHPTGGHTNPEGSGISRSSGGFAKDEECFLSDDNADVLGHAASDGTGAVGGSGEGNGLGVDNADEVLFSTGIAAVVVLDADQETDPLDAKPVARITSPDATVNLTGSSNVTYSAADSNAPGFGSGGSRTEAAKSLGINSHGSANPSVSGCNARRSANAVGNGDGDDGDVIDNGNSAVKDEKDTEDGLVDGAVMPLGVSKLTLSAAADPSADTLAGNATPSKGKSATAAAPAPAPAAVVETRFSPKAAGAGSSGFFASDLGLRSSKSDDQGGNEAAAASSKGGLASFSANADASGGFMPRATSMVGTMGYMAPEVILGSIYQTWGYGVGRRYASSEDGYTKAVDWWSLGVTMYTMLVGKAPFSKMSIDEIMALGDVSDSTTFDDPNKNRDEFFKLFEKVDYSALEDQPVMVSFLKSLLVVQESKRLGYRKSDWTALKCHPVFADILWDKIETKSMAPPHIPVVAKPLEAKKPKYKRLRGLLKTSKRSVWFEPDPNLPRMQRYFNSWTFASADAVADELDAAATVELSRRNAGRQNSEGSYSSSSSSHRYNTNYSNNSARSETSVSMISSKSLTGYSGYAALNASSEIYPSQYRGTGPSDSRVVKPEPKSSSRETAMTSVMSGRTSIFSTLSKSSSFTTKAIGGSKSRDAFAPGNSGGSYIGISNSRIDPGDVGGSGTKTPPSGMFSSSLNFPSKGYSTRSHKHRTNQVAIDHGKSGEGEDEGDDMDNSVIEAPPQLHQ